MFFDGKAKGGARSSGSSSVHAKKDKSSLVEDTKRQREERALIQKKKLNATYIQRYIRRFVVRNRVRNHLRLDYDNLLSERTTGHVVSVDSTMILMLCRLINIFYQNTKDRIRLMQLEQILSNSFVQSNETNILCQFINALNGKSDRNVVNSYQINISRVIALSIQNIERQIGIINSNTTNSTNSVESLHSSTNCLHAFSSQFQRAQAPNIVEIEISFCRLLLSSSCSTLRQLLLLGVYVDDYMFLVLMVQKAFTFTTGTNSTLFGLHSVYENKIINHVTVDLLTIPNIDKIPLLLPILSQLACNDCHGWGVALKHVITTESRDIHAIKFQFISNLCSILFTSNHSDFGITTNAMVNISVVLISVMKDALATIPLDYILKFITDSSHNILFAPTYLSKGAMIDMSGEINNINRLEFLINYRRRRHSNVALDTYIPSISIVSSLRDRRVIGVLFESLMPDDIIPLSSSTHASIDSMFSLIEIYSNLLMSCPVKVELARERMNTEILIKSEILTDMMFNCSTNILRKLWKYLESFGFDALHEAVSNPAGATVDKHLHSHLLSIASNVYGDVSETRINYLQSGILKTLYLLCVSFSQLLTHSLKQIDDNTLFNRSFPLSTSDLQHLIAILKTWLKTLYTRDVFADENPITMSDYDALREKQAHYITAAVGLYNSLYARNERRPFLNEDHWTWTGIHTNDISITAIDDARNPSRVDSSCCISDLISNIPLRSQEMRTVVSTVPQVIPFQLRIMLFQELLHSTRTKYETVDIFGAGSTRVNIRRNQLVENAFDSLQNVSDLRRRIQISFVSEDGTPEAGIDGGGLFKSFIDLFGREAFDPIRGFFHNTSLNLLLPNAASALINDRHMEYFNFFGKMLGKAIFEGIVVEPQFSGIFLNHLLGRENHVDDLQYLDTTMYNSIMSLKILSNSELVALGLTFEIEYNSYGHVVSVPLVPGGGNLLVDQHNVDFYVNRYAKHKLHEEIKHQSNAFLHGFRQLIPEDWIRLFNLHELQVLISGHKRPIDIQDMRRHCSYGSGYHDSQPYIQMFWDIVSDMALDEQEDFLKFVTSVPRLPLLGAKSLNPGFAIQRVPSHYPGEESQASRLPTASTCANLLKLPQYESREELKGKLLLAIRNTNTFEFS